MSKVSNTTTVEVCLDDVQVMKIIYNYLKTQGFETPEESKADCHIRPSIVIKKSDAVEVDSLDCGGEYRWYMSVPMGKTLKL